MTYSVGTNARMGRLRYLTLASATLAAVSCVPNLPEGNLACGPDIACPPDWHCWASDQTCYSSPEPRKPIDSGQQTPLPDASGDAEGPDWTRPDTGTRDAEPDTGTRDAEPDTGAPDPRCERAKTEETNAIYVSPSSASGESMDDCGSRDRPCASINHGIERAVSIGVPNVYVNEGTYPEQIQLRAGITLVGGWNKVGNEWWNYCGADPEKHTKIEAPSNIGVSAEYEGEVELAVLSVVTKPAAEPGETSYGVFARGSATSLKLRRVRIEAADGGDGSASAAGTAPDKPAMSCAAGAELPAGPAGEPGRGAAAGGFDAEGYHPATAEPGQPGSRGDNGQASAQACSPCMVDGTCANNSWGVCDGTRDGTESCPTPGDPGCAGLPGQGGDGGQSGGGSIALFAWGARVELEESRLSAGDGGDGALGAEGTPGGPGGDGTTGTPGAVCTLCVSSFLFREPISPPFKDFSDKFAGTQAKSPAAADPEMAAKAFGPSIFGSSLCRSELVGAIANAGRSGTPGSAGGRGGDGAGGPSYALYRGGGAVIQPDDKTILEHGQPGVSLGAGASGLASNVAGDGDGSLEP